MGYRAWDHLHPAWQGGERAGIKSMKMIQTLINADEVEWVQSNIDADKAMRFHYNHPTLSAISGWLSMWYIRLVLDTICKVLGHNIEYDGGYANPDSGGEGFRCTRCGQDWWHQYY